MNMRAPVFWACALAAWLPAAPALAWGPLSHAIIAQRAFAELAPRAPWLAPHRDAFDWGAACADLQEAPGAPYLSRARTHASDSLRGLWREAQASHDRGAQAFVVGWAVHVGADDAFDAYESAHGPGWAGKDAPPALLGWAVDALLIPKAGPALTRLGRAAAMHLESPASAPIAAMVGRVLAVDDATYQGWARLTASACLGGPDRYLAERARALRLEPFTAAALEPPARLALGDLTPWLTRAVRGGVDRARALAKAAPDPRHEKETR
ncbi:MAG: hypothetical protein JWM80_5691 [Cyanobacteria bacterium RYN_339]|nr:hypothetical protein [Cyanobacteria bacterium RYN_339]